MHKSSTSPILATALMRKVVTFSDIIKVFFTTISTIWLKLFGYGVGDPWLLNNINLVDKTLVVASNKASFFVNTVREDSAGICKHSPSEQRQRGSYQRA